MKKLLIGLLALGSLAVYANAQNVISCEGQMMGVDDELTVKINFEMPNETYKRVHGEAIFTNTYLETEFTLGCYDEVLTSNSGKKYFICEPREDYLNLRLVVFPETKTVVATDLDLKFKIAELSCK